MTGLPFNVITSTALPDDTLLFIDPAAIRDAEAEEAQESGRPVDMRRVLERVARRRGVLMVTNVTLPTPPSGGERSDSQMNLERPTDDGQ